MQDNKKLYYQHQIEKDFAEIERYFEKNHFKDKEYELGAELEFFVLDEKFRLAGNNLALIAESKLDKTASEMCSSCIELQTDHYLLNELVFSRLFDDLQQSLNHYHKIIKRHNMNIVMIGMLPHISIQQPLQQAMTNGKRYHELASSKTYAAPSAEKTIDNIVFPKISHPTGLGCSYQVHLKIPISQSIKYYYVALFSTAIMVAINANSPFIEKRITWQESRIPYYEHLSDRFYFNKLIPQHSVFEIFDYQYKNFSPVHYELTENNTLLPAWQSLTETIYPWLRPVIGWEEDGQPHLRFEIRVMSCLAHLEDMMAHTVLWLGLLNWLIDNVSCQNIPLSVIRNNFYQSAKYGINTSIQLDKNKNITIKNLVKAVVADLPNKLEKFSIPANVAQDCSEIILNRLSNYESDAQWQVNYLSSHKNNYDALIEAYVKWQQQSIFL